MNVLLSLVFVTSVTMMPLPWNESSRHNEIDINEIVRPEGLDYGDVRLTEQQKREIIDTESTSNRRRRALTSDIDYLWPNGIVPLKISNQFSKAAKTLIRIRMATIESVSCIKFVEIFDGEKEPFNYVNIISGSGCWSYVGRIYFYKKQDLSLQHNACLGGRAPIHELLHAIGFFHEQSRTDRDDFIKINWANIIPGNERNFQKVSRTESLGVPYDIGSIMHYPRWAFSKSFSKPTIEVVDSTYKGPIGGSEMTESDILQLNLLYKCPQKELLTTTASTKIPTIRTTTREKTTLTKKTKTTKTPKTKTTTTESPKTTIKTSTTKELKTTASSTTITKESTTTKLPTTTASSTIIKTESTTTKLPTTTTKMTTTTTTTTEAPTSSKSTETTTASTTTTASVIATKAPTTKPEFKTTKTKASKTKSSTKAITKQTKTKKVCTNSKFWCTSSLEVYCTNEIFKITCGKLCGC